MLSSTRCTTLYKCRIESEKPRFAESYTCFCCKRSANKSALRSNIIAAVVVIIFGFDLLLVVVIGVVAVVVIVISQWRGFGPVAAEGAETAQQ